MSDASGAAAPSNALDLDIIAARLEALEETIIYRLVDRAQFAWNPGAYEPGQSSLRGEEVFSLFESRLRAQERMDAEFGRYQVPEERPFLPQLPDPRREVRLGEIPLRAPDWNIVNQTGRLQRAYLAILPDLCAHRDDRQYGSSVEHDVSVLQAAGRRVHYGALYVAEAKFRSRSDEYRAAAARGDTSELERMLTRPEVEARIIERLERKVIELQQHVNRRVRRVVEPTVVVDFYRRTIIPLTKLGQIAYLLGRADSPESKDVPHG